MRQFICLQPMYRVPLVIFLSVVLVSCGKQPSATTSRLQATTSIQDNPVIPTALSPTALTALTFPTQYPLPDPQAYPAAQFSGQLLLVNGCIRIDTAQSSYLIIWPFGFRYQFEEGQLTLVDQTGTKRARQNENVQIGGGEIASDRAAWQNTLGLQQSPPANCPGPYWYAAPDIEVVR